jgi:serine/threonine protein kinase/tetratricopeptide (TPR) repeat protein
MGDGIVVIGETISHYKILSRLGAGGMGVVYEAEDTRLGRKVAIKFLPDELSRDPEAVQRFLREARVVSNLNHPHICTLYDIGTHEAKQFMVMELLDGQSLKDRIARGALSIDEVLDLGAQLGDALDAAHAQGIVHRDIKPANLFITRRGALKVLDFGVAKLNQAVRGGDLDATLAPTDQLTSMGTTIGTVSYMSPEQARGQEIDARSDVFSAGVVLYEMATGQLPFPGATIATIFEGLLTRQPAAPASIRDGVPAEFDQIVFRALEKDRELRYQGAAELRAELKRLKRARDTGQLSAASTAAAVTAAHPSRPVSPPPTSRPRWRRRMFIGAPLLTAALVGGFLLYKQVSMPALTERDSVVLSSVVNRTGDAMFDDTLGEALALQLRQSPFLNVVPDQQVQATLRLMSLEPTAAITAEVGREVCQRAGAKALLGGTIAMLGSSYVITLNAQDCVRGSVFAEEQGQAANKEAVLGVMGDAVSRFREKLGESLASVQRYDAKIEEATTRSLEALKAYSEGLRTRRTTGDFDAVPFFRRAIDLDPEFALAYARLGTVYGNLQQPDEARKMTTRAYQLRHKTSEVERHYIEARYFTLIEPDVQKALDVYRVWLATYPNDYTALVNSALLHKQLGDRSEAIRKLELATQVAPDQPLALTNLGQTYFEAQDYENATRVLNNALKLQDSTSSRIGLYQIAVLTGNTALAEQQIEAVRGRRDEVEMVTIRMYGAAFRGRFREAAALATEHQLRMAALSRSPQAGQNLMSLAISEALAGLHEQAKTRVTAAYEAGLLDDSTLDERLAVAAITRDAAAARELQADTLAEIKKSGGTPQLQAEGERGIRALVALARSDAKEALALLEPVIFDAPHSEQIVAWSIAQLELGNYEAAARGLAFLVSPGARSNLSSTLPFAHAMLAHAQMQLGRADEARQTYQKFFEIWKDADPDLPLLVRAREEFAKLAS